MTFNPYANQGAPASDPDEAAATQKAAEKIFSDRGDSVATTGDATPNQDSDQPGEIEDPDFAIER
ncbi:MAG: hypothetical protein JWP30_1511 [Homoserinimonas sp.]|nr:hypothetical protein [Homoserinimonas sp.]